MVHICLYKLQRSGDDVKAELLILIIG